MQIGKNQIENQNENPQKDRSRIFWKEVFERFFETWKKFGSLLLDLVSWQVFRGDSNYRISKIITPQDSCYSHGRFP